MLEMTEDAMKLIVSQATWTGAGGRFNFEIGSPEQENLPPSPRDSLQELKL